jgi:hypothetical protein
MSPLPIRKNSDEIPITNEVIKEPIIAQEFFNLFPFIEHLFDVSGLNKEEKQNLKEIWLHSSSLGDNTIQIGESVNKKVVDSLKVKGLISGVGERYRLTEKGSKLLRDAILNDEKSSLTKKASKKMISKSSYDFGDYVFVKVQNPEKFGARYVSIKKSIFAKKKIEPISINNYKIATRKQDGTFKNLSEYSEEELIQILHLAKKITDHSHKIVISGSKMTAVPVHKIKSFALKILEELNSRS